MSAPQGIDINAWINLDTSCPVQSEVFGEELQVRFGSGALGLVLTEDMVEKLGAVFAEATRKFREPADTGH